MVRVRAIVTVLSLVVAGWWLTPHAATALWIMDAAEDPVRLAAFRLTTAATPERLKMEIEAALAAGDADLAASFVALADGEAVAVDDALRTGVVDANAMDPMATAGAFLRGAIVGDADGVAGIGGAFAGDLVGIGDVRDLSREGYTYLSGGDPDQIIVGLSVVGLAVTGATWGTAGLAAPARAGMTVLKSAKRVGRLTRPFTESLGRMVARTVDPAAARRGLAAAGSFDLVGTRAALRGAVRPEALAPLVALADDAAKVTARAGVRALDDTLALATDPKDIARFARLAEGFGDRTRAVVKLFGRGAIIAADLIATLIGWLYAAAAWAIGLASGTAALGRWLARATRRRPRRQRRPAGHAELRSVAVP